MTHVGPDGAGHFVKMVHNGIEYGDMQLIAEAYDVLHRGLGLTHAETGDVFDGVEPRAARVVPHRADRAGLPRRSIPRPKQPLVDVILDKAGQKGTGKWTAQVALDLAVAIPTIAAAHRRARAVEPEGPARRGERKLSRGARRRRRLVRRRATR